MPKAGSVTLPATPEAEGTNCAQDNLTAQMDCLRVRKVGVVSAHRGRAMPDKPENSLSGLQAAWEAGIRLMEVDVATTGDGALVLLHDDTLDRTTTGEGPLHAVTLEHLKTCRLKDPRGNVLAEPVPTLAEALQWARRTGAALQLDIKPRTRVEDVIRIVQAEGMSGQVIIVTYRLSAAMYAHRLDPKVMISAPIRSTKDLITLRRRGFNLSRLIAWTGTREPDPSLWAALRKYGVEAAFGTSGRARQRLDDMFLMDGNPSEYADLVRKGVTVIASDTAEVAQSVMGQAFETCMRASQ